MAELSTKPYLLRALYEWCADSGLTPYLAVVVDERTVVPMGFVRNGEIVLNVSQSATNRLRIGNDLIEFQARFGGVAHELSIPIENVSAIYARETGHGMAFEVARPARADSGSRPEPVVADTGQSTADAGPPAAGAGPLAVRDALAAPRRERAEPAALPAPAKPRVRSLASVKPPAPAARSAEDAMPIPAPTAGAGGAGQSEPLPEPPAPSEPPKRRGGGRARLTRVK